MRSGLRMDDESSEIRSPLIHSYYVWALGKEDAYLAILQ